MAEFKNPGQQGGQDNKSLLVMMLVMVAVFFGLQFYKAKTNPPMVSPNAAQTAPAQPGSQAASQTPSSTQQPAAAAAASATTAAPGAVPAAPVVQATAAATTVVENELYRIEFTNRGAQVVSWILKRRPDGGEFKDNDGKPLDLVHAQAAQQFGYPLSLYTYDAASDARTCSRRCMCRRRQAP